MKRRPSVLFVHYTFPGVVGGVETVMAHHAMGMSQFTEVALMAGRGPVGLPGVRAVRIGLLDSLHPRIVEVSRTMHSGARTPAFIDLRARIVASLEPYLATADRVVLHNVATMAFNLPLVAALHDVAPTLPIDRLIVWVHDLAPPPGAAPMAADDPRRLLTRPLPGARYVAVSDERRRATATALGLQPAAIRVVPNGVDVTGVLRISRASATIIGRLGLSAADPLLVLPARLVRRKRIELAIEAAAILRDRGHDARLVVTGGPDPHDPDGTAYLQELRALVVAAGDRDVLLVDEIGHSAGERMVGDLYALADALVLPSASEGFGLPMLEAAVARLPIICSDLPVLREVVGPVATYVPLDGGPAAFADAIAQALAGSTLARLAGRIRRQSDWRRIVTEQVRPAILD
ncbi:MAG: glycosyltransferase family 4 protein [Candidatus Limnocylindrales bacterium]